jgi:hypothetical protein
MIIFKKELHLTLNGGLGDVILDLFYIQKIKKKYKNCKIIVYYRDDNSIPNPLNFSWGSTRKYSSSNGENINPISEILVNMKEIDNLIGTNIDNYTYGIRVFPEYFRKYFNYPEPNLMKPVLVSVLDKHTNKNVDDILKQMNSFDINISLHLRRNANKVLALAQLIEKNYENVNFILLGSSEHQSIPDIKLKNYISLIDSYKQNKYLMDIFLISTNCDLFIGGRGGFEAFHWLYKTPTICFFDDMGLDELKRGWWSEELWKQNLIKKLYLTESNLEEIFNNEIKNKIFN